MSTRTQFRTERFLLLGCSLLALGTLVVGCGDSKGNLEGEVILKPKAGGNKSVTGGMLIVWDDKNKQIAQSVIESNGHYRLSGLPPGKWKATINTDHLKGSGYTKTPPAGSKVNLPAEAKGGYVPIPPRYKNPASTPLILEVTSGSQQKNIEVTE